MRKIHFLISFVFIIILLLIKFISVNEYAQERSECSARTQKKISNNLKENYTFKQNSNEFYYDPWWMKYSRKWYPYYYRKKYPTWRSIWKYGYMHPSFYLY